jgi:hypothetical protein
VTLESVSAAHDVLAMDEFHHKIACKTASTIPLIVTQMLSHMHDDDQHVRE